jgi:acetyltransferase-like isoleucine patch superfamily enzyme
MLYGSKRQLALPRLALPKIAHELHPSRRCYRRFLRAGQGFTCGRGTRFFAQNRILVGDHVYFGRYCNIECDAIIGSYVLIANVNAHYSQTHKSL